ncbi:MAG: hypothetical protein WCI18_01630 [Pseudomonadota bacterium]
MKHFLIVLCSFISGARAFAAQDFKATHCEIFIDKVAGKQEGYHGAFGSILDTEVFLKINLYKTGPIRKVVFYSNRKTVDNSGNVKTETGFREVLLSSYFGAPDYFTINLGDLENHWWDRSDLEDRVEHEGAFYVELLDGVRLWLNPAESYGSHFLFDEGTNATLYAQGQIYTGSDGYIYGAARLHHLEDVKQTADYNTYWNPSHCR